MEDIVNSVLTSMSGVKKPPRIFLMGLFTVLRLYQGKATFRNLSRYSEMHEKRFSRWCRRAFDFAHYQERVCVRRTNALIDLTLRRWIAKASHADRDRQPPDINSESRAFALSLSIIFKVDYLPES
jgi:hypothetical protein